MQENKVEAPRAPTYLQPTVQLVNATLDNVRGGLSWEAKQDRGLSEAQKRLGVVLDGTLDAPQKPSLVYDGVQVTASSLRQVFEPFSKENVGYGIDSRFKGLVADLEIIEILEKGGVDAVNARVRRLFESLRTGSTTEQKSEAMGKINEILGRAIYLFPHLTAGVEVKLKPGALERTDEIEDRHYEAMRYWFNTLAEVYQDKKGAPLPDSLIFPLPYGFTTGTHGSGERAAMSQSREDVYLTFTSPKQDWSTKIPVLALGINAPLIVSRQTNFEIDEIESIQFTDKGEFTPYVDRRHGEDVLIEKGNPTTYYLRFRDFSDMRAFRERENLRELSDEEWQEYNNELVTVRSFSNLWNEDYYTRPRTLKRGFMAQWPDSGDVTLYELTGVKLPKKETEDAAALLYAKIRKGDREVLVHTREYKGNNVMRRLVEIPVAERKF